MQDDRLRAAKTLSSVFSELHREAATSPNPTPMALPSYLLLLYVFSCSKHLTKDNLFGCLMQWHWLVEDYVRWPSDLWCLGNVCVGAHCTQCTYVCVCVQFQVLALTQMSVVFNLFNPGLVHL